MLFSSQWQLECIRTHRVGPLWVAKDVISCCFFNGRRPLRHRLTRPDVAMPYIWASIHLPRRRGCLRQSSCGRPGILLLQKPLKSEALIASRMELDSDSSTRYLAVAWALRSKLTVFTKWRLSLWTAYWLRVRILSIIQTLSDG